MIHNSISLIGIGQALPGLDPASHDRVALEKSLFSADCHLSILDPDMFKIKVAGQLSERTLAQIHLSSKAQKIWPRATRIAAIAVSRALNDAGVRKEFILGVRALLIICSTQFSVEKITDLSTRIQSSGPSAIGLEYWLVGTPGSCASDICSEFGLNAPTLSLTGGCSVGLKALELAYSLLMSGSIDLVMVVGVDSVLEPLFLSSSTHRGRSGFHASSFSSNLTAPRPHDENQTGNSPGEGAIAL